MTTFETLSWGRIEKRLDSSAPWILSMGGARGVRIGFEPVHSRLYIRLPAADSPRPATTPYAELEIDIRAEEGQPVVEIATRSSAYYRELHRFATLLTEEYERPNATADEALRLTLHRWERLLSKRPIMTPDQQLGLAGELILAYGLLQHGGPKAGAAWIASSSQFAARHDFRVGAIDLEVKTTRATARRHFIHGIQQLVPADGHELFILSIRLESAGAGAGVSLPDLIRRVEHLSAPEPDVRTRIEGNIALSGYRREDERYYSERYVMADSPRLVRVDEACPRLVPQCLAHWLSEELAARIDHLSYRVDLEGLGVVYGTAGFDAVLPGVRLEL